jgi:hypothetical protein
VAFNALQHANLEMARGELAGRQGFRNLFGRLQPPRFQRHPMLNVDDDLVMMERRRLVTRPPMLERRRLLTEFHAFYNRRLRQGV